MTNTQIEKAIRRLGNSQQVTVADVYDGPLGDTIIELFEAIVGQDQFEYGCWSYQTIGDLVAHLEQARQA